MQAVFEAVRLRSWPLFDVVAARAKTMLLVVSNLAEWRSTGVFAIADAPEALLPRNWLGSNQTAPAR